MSARALADHGITLTLCCNSAQDMSRQIVRSEYASITIPEIELEIPATYTLQDGSQTSAPQYSSMLTTVEGLLVHIGEDLAMSQKEREESSPELYEQICHIIDEVEKMKILETGFTLVIDDPTGNSFIEPLEDGMGKSGSGEDGWMDPKLKSVKYSRTSEMLASLGFATEAPTRPEEEDVVEQDLCEEGEVFKFEGLCPSCGHDCATKMLPINIPYFKQVIIMATACGECGYKSSEVKSGSAISLLGRKITFSVEFPEDLSRDILKSETCSISIPEIGLDLHEGTLGGRFTTIEGLLTQIRDELSERVSFSTGDSADAGKFVRFNSLLEGLTEICSGKRPCTLVIDDPVANSYLQNIYAPDPDPQIIIEDYERTQEQNEDLGIADMVV